MALVGGAMALVGGAMVLAGGKLALVSWLHAPYSSSWEYNPVPGVRKSGIPVAPAEPR